MPVAVPLGVIAAARAGTWIDRAVMAFSVLGFSVPVFVLAYILILTFSIELDWLPVQGYRPLERRRLGVAAPPDPAEHRARHRLHGADRAHHARDACSTCSRRTTCAPRRRRGSRRASVLVGHALKNAAVPIMTVIGIGIALLISGAIVTETVFAIPGHRPADRRRDPAPRLSDHPGRDPDLLRRPTC